MPVVHRIHAVEAKGRLISNTANKDWVFHGSGGVRSTVPLPNIPGTGGSAMLVKASAWRQRL
jgi:hypothetical protein